MGALEPCFYLASDYKMDDLSEQHILDCAYGYGGMGPYPDYGMRGCQGGVSYVYYDWMIKKNRGRAEMEYCYPYENKVWPMCRNSTRCTYKGSFQT